MPNTISTEKNWQQRQDAYAAIEKASVRTVVGHKVRSVTRYRTSLTLSCGHVEHVYGDKRDQMKKKCFECAEQMRRDAREKGEL